MESGVIQVNQFKTRTGVPRMQRSYSDGLIDPFNGASNGCDSLIVIRVVPCPLEIVMRRETGSQEEDLMKVRAEVINSPGVVIVAFSASRSSFIKRSSSPLTSTPD